MEENQNNIPQKNVVEEPVVQQQPVVEQPIKPGVVPDDGPGEFVEPKKKGKILKIIIGVVIVLIIAAVGAFFYFKSQRNATKYIDTQIKDVKSSIEDAFSNGLVANAADIDFLEDDFIVDGKVKITASGDMFGALDGTELGANLKFSANKEYVEATIDAKDKNTSIGGTVALDGKKVYIDSKDILKNPLFSDVQVNVFEELKNGLKEANLEQYAELLDMSKMKEISLKAVDYFGEAFKETSTSTKQKGMNVEYTYEFNKETVTKALNKLIASIKSDSSIKDLVKEMTEMDISELTLPELEFNNTLIVKIEVGLLDNKLKNLTVTFDGKDIISRVDTDKYKFKYDFENEKNYAILTIKDDEFGVQLFKDGSELFNISFVTKKNITTIKFTVTPAAISGTIEINEVNKNETKIKIDANLVVVTLKANFTIKTSSNKYEAEGTIEASMSAILGSQAQSIKVEFSGSSTYGKDKITKATFSGAKNATTLTAQENEEITKNIEERISKFGAYSLIESLFTSYLDFDDSHAIIDQADIEIPSDFDFDF